MIDRVNLPVEAGGMKTILILLTTALALPLQAQDKDATELKALMESLVKMGKETRTDAGKAALDKLVVPLALPNAKNWFTEVFGADKAKNLELEYRELSHDIRILSGFFGQCGRRDQSEVTISAFKDASDPNATGSQQKALKAMIKPVTLYSVRFTHPVRQNSTTGIWSFVKVDGKFRFVGRMEALK